jgi:hypothetical protein
MEEREMHSPVRSYQSSPFWKVSPQSSAFPDYKLEYNDCDHVVRINDGPTIQLLTKEYVLLLLLWEQRQQEYVNYKEMARSVWLCELDDKVLHSIHKRISGVRGKIAKYGLDIINIPYRGYKVGLLKDIAVPRRHVVSGKNNFGKKQGGSWSR